LAIFGLLGFVIVMWVIILAACAFLIVFVAPIDHFLGINNRIITSSVQASIAILLVVVLVLILDRFKKIYIRKKLNL
jgi:hypothetical protein